MPGQKLGVLMPLSATALARASQDRAALDRRQDAGRDADDQRDQHRHAGQLDRHRQLLQHQLEHLLLRAQRFAQVAAQHTTHPVRISNRQRFVEVQLGAQVGDDVRVLVLAGQDLGRIAGQQLLQAEDQHRHEQQRRQHLRQALGQELEHGWWTGADDCRREVSDVRPPPPAGLLSSPSPSQEQQS